SRRRFLQAMGGLGALGVSTTAYGFSAPVVRLRVARYHISPPQWPAGLKLRDYVTGHRKVTRIIPDAEWAAVLAGLKAPLGVHAVLGNHDWWEDKEVQRVGHGLPSAGRALEAA